MYHGKYVLSQLADHIPRYEFNRCVDRYRGNSAVKKLTCWNQFLALFFGQISHRESLRDVVNCLSSQQGKIRNLGFSSIISRSTLSDASEKRDWRIYRDLAGILIDKARKLYAGDDNFNLELNGACYIIDSSVIELCLSLFSWAKLKTVRAGVKLNLQMDLDGNIPAMFEITSAKRHDLEFLDSIEIEPEAHYILDRGYIDYGRLYKIHRKGAFFVIRAKECLGFERIYSNRKEKGTGICCDQIIKLSNWKSSKRYPEKLRRIKFFDQESKKYFTYLSNDFNLSAEKIAALYKHRWQIELFFKWIKQHLKIKAFWGRSENAVKTQICIAICAYLVVAIFKKQWRIEKNLYEILQILNVSVLTKTPMVELFSDLELQNFKRSGRKQACLWDL
ncbi:MAG: IS4 family transposase [Candidatus Moranbacteria bacterium]|nr:IS4 family transposase [Candidatus Moranbacteria bacterium]